MGQSWEKWHGLEPGEYRQRFTVIAGEAAVGSETTVAERHLYAVPSFDATAEITVE